MRLYRRSGPVINGVTMAANITSEPVDIKGSTSISIHHVSASATHDGTINIQVSNDETNWVTIAAVASTVSAGVAHNDFVDLSDVAGKFLRVVYTRTAGTGTLYSYVHVKSLR